LGLLDQALLHTRWTFNELTQITTGLGDDPGASADTTILGWRAVRCIWIVSVETGAGQVTSGPCRARWLAMADLLLASLIVRSELEGSLLSWSVHPEGPAAVSGWTRTTEYGGLQPYSSGLVAFA